MSEPAQIDILRGPDEGKVFSVDEDLVQLGRGEENQVALTGEDLQEHQASIIRRNGRYAIFTPVEQGVEVDGKCIPTEQWVWLPETTEIRFGESTLLRFHYKADADSATEAPQSTPSDSEEPPSQKVPTKPPRPRRQKSPPARQLRKVAKFITDSTSGDQFVRLGEDGKLPELELTESYKPTKTERKKVDKPPTLLYFAVGISMLMSLAILFVDFESSGSSATERSEARKKIQRYYGAQGNLKVHQRLLRDAQRAYSVGNRVEERRAYKQVLDLLNSEDITRSLTGLTGDRKRDDELHRLIGILMNR